MKSNAGMKVKMWHRTTGKRVLSVLLAGSMLAGSVPYNALPVMAEEAPLTVGSSDDGWNDGGLNIGGPEPSDVPLDAWDDSAPALTIGDEDYSFTDAADSLDVSYWDEQYDDYSSPNDGYEVLMDSDDGYYDEANDSAAPSDDDQGRTVAVVISSYGETAYTGFSAAWEAAVQAAAEDGSAVLELAADWVSNGSGKFGSGYDFADEGSIIMDVPGGRITIDAKGHEIERQGNTVAGGCCFSVFGGTLEIKDAVITGGNSTTDGGAILVLGGSVLLDGVVLKNNRAGAGGGLCVTGGSVVVKDSEISGNSTDNAGGGIFVDTDYASLSLEGKTVVSGNVSGVEGDLYIAGSSPISIDQLEEGSYVSIACGAVSEEQYLGNISEAAALGLESAQDGYEIRWENGSAWMALRSATPEEALGFDTTTLEDGDVITDEEAGAWEDAQDLITDDGAAWEDAQDLITDDGAAWEDVQDVITDDGVADWEDAQDVIADDGVADWEDAQDVIADDGAAWEDS